MSYHINDDAGSPSRNVQKARIDIYRFGYAQYIDFYSELSTIDSNYEINRFILFLKKDLRTRNFGNAIICVFWLSMLDIKYIYMSHMVLLTN